MKPKISICVPTYNQKPEYLRECLRSALSQQYDSLEVVVSENHSTNDSPALLREFFDPRLRIVTPQNHLNMKDNFGFCAAESSGEYINFLSSDDRLHPGFCRQMAQILDAHPNVSFAHSAVQRIDANGWVIGCERSIHPSFVRSGVQELQRYVWQQCNVFIAALIRKTAYQAVGGTKYLLDMVGDWDLSLRLLTVGNVAYCSDVLAAYRDWSTPQRRSRFVAHVRDTRLLYQRLESDGTVSLIHGGRHTLIKARRGWAINFASSLPIGELSENELAEAVSEIRLMDDSQTVRTRLFLVQAGFGSLFACKKRMREWLRQRVKSLLYPKKADNPA
ncbi:MAG: glycosyltransferase [candidate division NC10 bacterium]|nr:glycosyltransferase [candidate division NC10 bacterium]